MAKTKEAVKKKTQISKENLEVAAYFHWLNRGCPDRDDVADWVEAEKELAGVSEKS